MAFASFVFFILEEKYFCTSESGVLEMMQAGILALSVLLFSAMAFSNKFSNRAIPAFFAVLCYALFLREVDFDKMNLSPFLEFMLYGLGRHLTVALSIALILMRALFNFRRYFAASLTFIKSKYFAIMFVGLLFLICGWQLDSLDGQLAQYFEEITELIGYILIFSVSARILENRLPETSGETAFNFT